MGFVKDAWNGITGKTGAKAAEKAGNLQADSSKYAADLAQKQFEQTRQDQMPWLNAGKNALGQLQDYVGADKGYNDIYGGALQKGIAGLGGGFVGGSSSAGLAPSKASTAGGASSRAYTGQSFGNLSVDKFADEMRSQIQSNYDAGKYTGGLSLDDFEVDPSYQFRKAEGAAGLEGSAAAGGSLLSGAALKSLNRYNSDLASQEYGNAWQRDQAQKQQLFGVDTGIRGQDLSVFADGANRKLTADSTNAQLNQNNSQFNASQLQNNSQYNAGLSQSNNQFNASQAQQNAQYNLGLKQNNNQFNASLNQNAQLANQNYGLSALGTLMNARSQDYNLFSGEDSRRYNQYANLAGVGQQAANNLGQFGANNVMNQGNAAIAGANAQANGLTAGAAAQGGAWTNILGLGAQAMGIGKFI